MNADTDAVYVNTMEYDSDTEKTKNRRDSITANDAYDIITGNNIDKMNMAQPRNFKGESGLFITPVLTL